MRRATNSVVMGRHKKTEPTMSLRLYASSVRKIRLLAIRAGRDPADWFAENFGAALERKHTVDCLRSTVGG